MFTNLSESGVGLVNSGLLNAVLPCGMGEENGLKKKIEEREWEAGKQSERREKNSRN